jgi:hypothetical protein
VALAGALAQIGREDLLDRWWPDGTRLPVSRAGYQRLRELWEEA